MRKTKIVCTLGPSTDNEEVMRQLMLEGMNVARCNFSHGVYEEHKKRMDMVRKIRKEVKKPVAILLDTKGPEVRVRQFKNGKITLQEGQLFTLTSEEVEGTEEKVSVTYGRLYEDLEVGMKVLIDDGLIEMKVEKVERTNIICRVINGGVVSNNKGINVPDVNLSMPYLSDKDREDILFGIEQDVDFVEIIKAKYGDEFKCSQKIADLIKNEYQVVLPDEEMVYLTLHIKRMTVKELDDTKEE